MNGSSRLGVAFVAALMALSLPSSSAWSKAPRHRAAVRSIESVDEADAANATRCGTRTCDLGFAYPPYGSGAALSPTYGQYGYAY